MIKNKVKLSPIVTFIILIFATILVSGFLHFLSIQSEYSSVNTITNELVNNVIEVKNLFSTSGIKHIITSSVSGFMNFTPLSSLIIVLIGIGILEYTGFLKTFFTLLTRNAKRYTLTFILVFISLCASLFGNIGFVVILPLGALLFKYGRRNPLSGIIASFASMSFGYGINVLLSANDSTLLTMTLNAAKVLDPKYKIGVFFALFIMALLLIIVSIIFTNITERRIMPKLPRYESEEEEVKITNKELRGFIIGLGAGLVYLLIIIYMIIPGLPLSGAFLDSGGSRYIDMLFGNNSLFSKGLVFIVTMFFVIVGYGYGIMTKKIKGNKEVTDSLAYSLDGIGSIIVLLFFASLFINIYTESNIGEVFTSMMCNIISSLKFTGVGLILITIVLVLIANILCPSSIIKYNILSGTLVPLFMNASISPEFTQIIYSLSESITNGITPLFTFFVIYIAFMEKYNKGDTVGISSSIKYMIPYSVAMFIIVVTVVLSWYLIGIPLGIGSFPGVVYGA